MMSSSLCDSMVILTVNFTSPDLENTFCHNTIKITSLHQSGFGPKTGVPETWLHFQNRHIQHYLHLLNTAIPLVAAMCLDQYIFLASGYNRQSSKLPLSSTAESQHQFALLNSHILRKKNNHTILPPFTCVPLSSASGIISHFGPVIHNCYIMPRPPKGLSNQKICLAQS